MKEFGGLLVILLLVFSVFTFGSWYGVYESIVYRTETLDCVLKGAVDE
jgi:hypothetical protein